jgi:hypothetical protein
VMSSHRAHVSSITGLILFDVLIWVLVAQHP